MITQFFKPQGQARKARAAVRAVVTSATQETPLFTEEYTAAISAAESGDLTYANCSSRLHHLVHPSWRQVLSGEFKKPYWKQLCAKLEAEGKKGANIFPTIKEVFAAFAACPFDETRIVILGQDPYHGPNQAHGLCFSVKFGVAVPPSLRNMYKLLESDIKGFTRPKHGNLSYWAAQGVLMRTVFLLLVANANSHSKWGWQQLTDAAISAVNERHRNVVFLLWGGFAQKKAKSVDKKKHHILKASHPSPLSASRGDWFQCAHFSKCNSFLVGRGLKKVDWTLPADASELEERLQQLRDDSAAADADADTEEASTVVSTPDDNDDDNEGDATSGDDKENEA